MDIRRLDDTLSVTPQIRVEDIAEIAQQGFRTLVANRPDQEEPGQPPMADIEAAAKAHGLNWIYMPVESGNITDEDVERFIPVIRNAQKPILAFCRSGTRCTILWALSMATELPPEEIMTRARSAGYDISGLAPRIAHHARKSR